MKSITLLILFFIGGLLIQAQVKNQKIKYITYAPDGSIAFTLTDNINGHTININASDNFYKYEVVDLLTANPVLISKNKGKSCSIDKTKLNMGDYKLKLYNKNFIITSKITILGFKSLNNLKRSSNAVALNKTD